MAPGGNEHLPIKVIGIQDRDYAKISGGGGGRKLFTEIDDEFRESFAAQLDGISEHFAPAFDAMPGTPAVAKVRLHSKALAKSHRPANLLSARTCPIIGVREIGELLVAVTPQGLSRLREAVLSRTARASQAAMSTVLSVTPYTEEDALGGFTAKQLKGFEQESALKLRIFRHRNAPENVRVHEALRSLFESLEVPLPKLIRYSPQIPTYRLEELPIEGLVRVAGFMGTQSIAPIPVYSAVETASIAVRKLTEKELPEPDPVASYPSVGIVDGGIDPSDVHLAPWVEARELYVTSDDADYDHGSFVAGMAVFGHKLNHSDPRFPETPVYLTDVAAVSKDGVSEDQLCTILEEVIPKYPDVRYWNLSLGTKTPCASDEFSDFAVFLDRLQDEYGVTFVIASGNYESLPLRGWPPDNLGGADRVCPPADSMRAVTVGSLAHADTANTRVRKEDPSPFSRRGPGPVFVTKPELSHYGGNCDAKGGYQQTGVLSLDGKGNLAENIGTSFSTPTMTALLASVHHEVQGEPSRSLVRALTVHSALLRGSGVTAESLRYRGFGTPDGVAGIVGCVPWAATLVFEPALVTSHEVIKDPYPIPDVLRGKDGKVQAEFFMTLAYDPPLDASKGVEYCRVNVEASLGVYGPNAKGEMRHVGKVPAEPKDLKEHYEEHLIKHGFKWAPTKVYHKKYPKGVTGDHWRVKLSVTNRSEFESEEPQSAALVVTVADLDRKKPVYDETVQLLGRIGWEVGDLKVSDRVRLRG